MKLRVFRSYGVGGVADAERELARGGDEPPALVVVTGPPASGKSQWLRAIAAHKEAIAPYGSVGWLSSTVRREAPRSKTQAEWSLSPDEQRYGGFPAPATSSEVTIEGSGAFSATADPGLLALFDRWDPTVTLGRVASIPPLRLPVPYPSGASDFVSEQRMHALSDDAAKLAAAVSETKRILRAGDAARLGDLHAILERFDIGVRVVGLTGDGELDLALRGGQRIPLSCASSSQKQAVATAALFCTWRLKHSIVLYDTPEACLPPGRAAAWLQALAAHEPTNQWIVATSDPAVGSLPDAHAIQLGGGQLGGGQLGGGA